MEETKGCFTCRFYDGVCCMYECKCLAILDEEENCNHYDFGDYNQLLLEQVNYR